MTNRPPYSLKPRPVKTGTKSTSFRVSLSEAELQALYDLVPALAADSPSHVVRHLIKFAATDKKGTIPLAGIKLENDGPPGFE